MTSPTDTETTSFSPSFFVSIASALLFSGLLFVMMSMHPPRIPHAGTAPAVRPAERCLLFPFRIGSGRRHACRILLLPAKTRRRVCPPVCTGRTSLRRRARMNGAPGRPPYSLPIRPFLRTAPSASVGLKTAGCSSRVPGTGCAQSASVPSSPVRTRIIFSSL